MLGRALRLADGGRVDYAKHFVKIELANDHFLIEDNCGGIPREVAKNYAFKKPVTFESFVPPSSKPLEQLGGVGAFADGPD